MPLRSRNRSSRAGTAAAHGYRAGTYLTDEVFLYRVVGRSSSGRLQLEDCFGLDVVAVSVGDLQGRRLRVVKPAALFG